MNFSQDDIESSEFPHSIRNLDIDAPACHIGHNGHTAFLSGLGENLGFIL